MSWSAWVAILKYHRQDGLTTEINCSQFRRLDKGQGTSIIGFWWGFLTCLFAVPSHVREREETNSGDSSDEGTNYFSKDLSPSSTALGIKVSTYELWGDTSIWLIAYCFLILSIVKHDLDSKALGSHRPECRHLLPLHASLPDTVLSFSKVQNSLFNTYKSLKEVDTT